MPSKHVPSWSASNRRLRWGVLITGLLLFTLGNVLEATADEKSAIAAIEFYGCRVRAGEDGTSCVVVGMSNDLTDSGVVSRIAELGRVTDISLTNCHFDPRELESLTRHSPFLQSLNLHGTPTDDDALLHIREATELQWLTLGQTKITGGGLAHLAKLQKLELLWLDKLAIGDESVEHLVKLKGLKELRIRGPHTFTAEGEKRLHTALPGCVIRLGRFEETDASRFVLRKYGPAAEVAILEIERLNGHIVRRREVDRIGLYEQDLTKNSFLSLLSNFPPLQGVILSKCQFDPADVKHLVVSKDRLQELYLNDTPTDDGALKEVGKLTNLTMLGLSRTKVTSAGMAHLSDLGNLRYLALGGTAVGDEAIVHLAKLKSLQKLDVVGKTGFTKAGRDELQKALPKCEISIKETPR